MKRFLIALVVTSMVAFNSFAFAAEEGTTVDAGITPDSILYTADKLFEDLQLAIASSSEEKAELLLQFAQERLSEAKEMTEAEKTQFVETAVKDYMATLQQAQDAVLEVAVDENQDHEVVEELIAELEDTAEVPEEVSENLGEEQQQELEEATEQVTYTANVVKNIDTQVVTALREQGFGFGQIAHVAVLAEKSGKSVEEIASLVRDDKKGIGEVAKELGLHPSEMKPKSLKVAEVPPAEGHEEAPTEETTPVDDEYASVVESVEKTIAAATTPIEEGKPVENTKKQVVVKAETVKKVTEEVVKPEASKTDEKAVQEKKEENTQVQDKKTEETKVQPVNVEKTSAQEAPKQNEVKKEESKSTDSAKAETPKSDGAKGGSSGSNSSSSSSGGGNSSGGNGKK